MAILYKLTCVTTGKIYVGWTTLALEVRWLRHQRTDKKCYIQHCIKKYGADNFLVEELGVFDKNENAIAKEIDLIREWKLNISRYPDGPGMNMTDGGEGTIGYAITDRQRENLSRSLTGKAKTKAHVESIRRSKEGAKNPMFGREPTQKQRESARERFKNNNPNKPGKLSHRYGKPGHWKGKALSSETRKKIGAALKGQKRGQLDAAVKKKLSAATKNWLKKHGHPNQGKKASEESRERMRCSRLAYIEKQKSLGLAYNHTKRKIVPPKAEG